MQVEAECLICSESVTGDSDDYGTFVGHMQSKHKDTKILECTYEMVEKSESSSAADQFDSKTQDTDGNECPRCCENATELRKTHSSNPVKSMGACGTCFPLCFLLMAKKENITKCTKCKTAFRKK